MFLYSVTFSNNQSVFRREKVASYAYDYLVPREELCLSVHSFCSNYLWRNLHIVWKNGCGDTAAIKHRRMEKD